MAQNSQFEGRVEFKLLYLGNTLIIIPETVFNLLMKTGIGKSVRENSFSRLSEYFLTK